MGSSSDLSWSVIHPSRYQDVLTSIGEISPPAFRASFGGLAYQLGNMASSAAAQIEATAGESLKLKGTNIPDYVSTLPPPVISK
jgi:hypothetical protein